MAPKTVVVLGAGATKACGGPLTYEILPKAFEHRAELEREGYLDIVDHFLIDQFHLPAAPADRRADDYPSLPLLLSLVDVALARKQPFGRGWGTLDLARVRDGLEYLVFALIERELRSNALPNHHHVLLTRLAQGGGSPTVISLNYDIIVDNTMIAVAEGLHGKVGFPSYGCEVSTPFYHGVDRFGTLLKLHGSLNWLYCPNCHRLDIGIATSGMRMSKVLGMLYQVPENALENRYGCHGTPCVRCGTFTRPVLITPTHHKDYRNPHVAQVWYLAEQALREAERVVFIGYSLPDDDLEVVYLLKRGLAHLSPQQIVVVEYDTQERKLGEHPVGARYRLLFGDVDWHPSGFERWLATPSGGLR